MRFFILTFFFIPLFINQVQSQKICATSTQVDPSFEKWIQNKIQFKQAVNKFLKTTETIYTIPVVVHVIHQGEAIGTGINITEAQINSQIETLNKDYRRKNADATNTLDIFKPVASDINIEFQLAKQDPDGAPTNGIVRVNGFKDAWNFEEGNQLKSISYWPSNNYLNIWVTKINGGVIGFADLPISDMLPGLEESLDNPVEGVVIDYQFFGIGPKTVKGTIGRTATHEIGHYLGLRHIWGDAPNGKSGCDYDDFCNDTPKASAAHFGCPVTTLNSCNGNIPMYQNYMDYTSDPCMNLFTIDQKMRMRTVLENSLRRKSLLTSPALTAPTITQNDAAVTGIISPDQFTCQPSINPQFLLRNMGTNTLNSITISYSINNKMYPSIVVNDLNILSYETSIIHIPPIELTNGSGVYKIKIFLENPNEVSDEHTINDTASFHFKLSASSTLPLTEVFNTLPAIWDDLYLSSSKKWEIKEEQGNGTNNKAVFLDLKAKRFGEIDALITPYFDLSGVNQASLTFKYAYTYRPSEPNFQDVLQILVSGDCGKNFSDPIFIQSGLGLTTAPPTNTPFIPTAPTEWKTVCIDLSSFAHISPFRIAFVVFSGNGNAIYIDDVEVKSSLTTGCLQPTKVDVPINQEIESDFSMYPIPAEDKLYIQLTKSQVEKSELVIYNVLGKEVMLKSIDQSVLNPIELDIHELSSGVYFLKIISPKEKQIIKTFIKN